MTALKVSDIKQFLIGKKDDSIVTLEHLQLMVNKTSHNKNIVQLIKSCVDNYTPYYLKEKLVNELTPSGIMSELIPTIALGRRAGHSTAAIAYAKQVTDRQVYIVTNSNVQAKELVKLLGPATLSKTYYYHALNNVTVMDLTCAVKHLIRIVPEDSIIIFDSSFAYNTPQLLPLISDLYLNYNVIFVGN